MKYTEKKFTLPAAGAQTKEENWDRAFMTKDQFFAKYGKPRDPDEEPVSNSN